MTKVTATEQDNVEQINEVTPNNEVEVISVNRPVVKNDMSFFEQKIESVKTNGSLEEKVVYQQFESYIKDMKPGIEINHTLGATKQRGLYNVLINIVNNYTGDKFTSAWSLVLNYFHENPHDVFGDRYIFRFAEQWSGDLDSLKCFQKMINLIRLTANPAKRKESLKSVNLKLTLSHPISEQGRNSITTFYK